MKRFVMIIILMCLIFSTYGGEALSLGDVKAQSVQAAQTVMIKMTAIEELNANIKELNHANTNRPSDGYSTWADLIKDFVKKGILPEEIFSALFEAGVSIDTIKEQAAKAGVPESVINDAIGKVIVKVTTSPSQESIAQNSETPALAYTADDNVQDYVRVNMMPPLVESPSDDFVSNSSFK